MIAKRIASAASAVAAVSILIIGGSGSASAAEVGEVTWKNVATGRCLLHPGSETVTTGSCGGNDSVWLDIRTDDGVTWNEVNRTYGWALDSNASGAVYQLSRNSGSYQRWYELKDSKGWYLKNKATARCLDSNGSGNVYTLGCNGGNYQRWS
ncbi:RICIN domain-containing protein [Streptomyces sp. NBC_01244]|uniref:RICIN domain-containing protein n=1 Tax=Streptomyces sp. NBC_01244 TaxID=2903797 RepID=UPI002E1117C3|nr:ricin-type beta-trefoil lectin domain protein [Streptomyces sp. NBC_01244]